MKDHISLRLWSSSCETLLFRLVPDLSSRWQVIIFPLRVNVNLKSLTVEEMMARRKVLHRLIVLGGCMPMFCMRTISAFLLFICVSRGFSSEPNAIRLDA